MAEANPVGVSYLDLIKKEIDEVIAVWNQHNPTSSWWSRAKGAWVSAVKFVMRATDYLIKVVEEKVPGGANKKATVMAAIGLLYDSIVAPLLPAYLKPVNSRIKVFVLNVLVSLTIDFIVEKYRDGSWTLSKKDVASLI